ncbi:MAG: sugar phosphate isomerase/epimerase, partial [Chloroflexota bacterium]
MSRFRLAVFTVMTPDLTVEETARTLQELGYDGVEWRVTTVPTAPVVPPTYWNGNRATVDITRLGELAPAVAELTRRHGMAMPCLGTYLTATDLPTVESAMLAAVAMGVPALRVGVRAYDGSRSYGELFREGTAQFGKVLALGERYGLRVLVELHMGNIIPGSAYAFRFVSQFDPRLIGCIYDPGNMVH